MSRLLDERLGNASSHLLQQLLVVGVLLLGDRQVVADAELALQVQRGARHLQLAVRHDHDAVAEEIGFVHEVRAQQNDAVLLLLFQKLPDLATRGGVHAGRGLVEEHDSTRETDEATRTWDCRSAPWRR